MEVPSGNQKRQKNIQMKKIALSILTLFVAATATIVSCDKAVKVPVSYVVETYQDTFVRNIYIPDSGTFDMRILVQFLSGYNQDPVTLKISGLPADITLTPDTIAAIPSYVQDFVFHTNHATHGTYNCTITGSAPEELSQSYSFTVTVISANCASPFMGALTGHNACSVAGDFTYSATGSSTGNPNELVINNFGGYGSNTNALVYLNCDNDSLTILSQNIGNGTTLSGYGTYTSTGMTIYYNATRTPTGGTDNCVATFTN